MDGSTPYTHIGWVPCISGHLFFEFTSCGLGCDSVHADINYQDIANRHVIISSIVNWKDEHKKKSGESCNLNGTYRVLLYSSFSPEADFIEGYVNITPADPADVHWNRIDAIIKEIKRLIRDRKDIDEKVSLLYSTAASLTRKKYYRVAFRINRSGFVKLFFKTNDIDSKRAKETIIRQSYYYIKYSWHKHQHHSDTAESLTTIHKLKGNKDNIGMEVINDLKRSLVILKRDFHISDFKGLLHAKGINSYAKSLIVSCHREKLISGEEQEDQERYFENISGSLQMLAESVQRDIDARLTISSNFRAILLFFLATIAPITIIYRDKIRSIIGDANNDNIFVIEAIAKVASSNTLQVTLSLTMVVGYFGYRYINLKMGAIFIANQWVKDTIDFIVREKEKAHVLAWIGYVIATTLFLSAIYSLVRG